MVGKKGFLRTLEAIIAIVILFGVILFITQKSPELETKVPSNVQAAQRVILEKIGNDVKYRKCVANYIDQYNAKKGKCEDNVYTLDLGGSSIFECGDQLNAFIFNNIPFGYGFACEVCEEPLSCVDFSSTVPFDKSVFTSTTFIAKDDDTKKVVRLYFWLK